MQNPGIAIIIGSKSDWMLVEADWQIRCEYVEVGKHDDYHDCVAR